MYSCWYLSICDSLESEYNILTCVAMTQVKNQRSVMITECSPSGCTPLGAALCPPCPGLGHDIGVVTPHEVTLSNLGLLLLQHRVQVLVSCSKN